MVDVQRLLSYAVNFGFTVSVSVSVVVWLTCW